jgi:hypothetical protein
MGNLWWEALFGRCQWSVVLLMAQEQQIGADGIHTPCEAPIGARRACGLRFPVTGSTRVGSMGDQTD